MVIVMASKKRVSGDTKKHAAADMEVVENILVPSAGGISTAELHAAGIDMRLTKADLLELLSSQLREQLGVAVEQAVEVEMHAGLRYVSAIDAEVRKTYKAIPYLEKELIWSE
jgi:hypothetical protein